MTETTHDLAWRELGNCVGVDPDLFFGGRGDNRSHAAAKRVCAGCEVRDECLAYALDNDERFGVWGWLSERQRRKIRAETKGPRVPAPCGTAAGYSRHRRHGEPPCEECRAAERAKRRALSAAHRARRGLAVQR